MLSSWVWYLNLIGFVLPKKSILHTVIVQSQETQFANCSLTSRQCAALVAIKPDQPFYEEAHVRLLARQTNKRIGFRPLSGCIVRLRVGD